MERKKKTWKRILVILLLAAVIWSLLPLIPFWMMEGAAPEDNNRSNIEKLKNNKGAYFSFIVFGDNHSGLVFNDAATIKEVWHMNREDRFRKVPIDFVISVGDVTLDGKRSHFLAYKKIQKLIKYPVIAAIGNHDDRQMFEEFCGEKEFAFSDRNSYFIVLDNEEGQLTGTQFRWLEEELKKGQEYDHIFIAMHKPPFDPYQQEWYNMDNSPWAYRFRKLCAEYRVDMVFTGHKHMFRHERFDDVDHIVTGGGGMLIEIPEADGGYLHYVRVMVNHDYVTYEVRKISPPLWEQLTYYIGKEALYWFRNLYGSGYLFWRNTQIQPLRVSGLNDREYWFEK
ncbi:MAG: metallophosphoesterase [Candidatus Omnitrophota bacterium]|nr:metallophosphoesterase [Candidatus Omnitrophota bacterium]